MPCLIGRREESRVAMEDDGWDGRHDDCNGKDPSEEAGCIDPPCRTARIIYLTAWTGYSSVCLLLHVLEYVSLTLTLSCPHSQKSFVIVVRLVNLLVKLVCQKSHTLHL